MMHCRERLMFFHDCLSCLTTLQERIRSFFVQCCTVSLLLALVCAALLVARVPRTRTTTEFPVLFAAHAAGTDEADREDTGQRVAEAYFANFFSNRELSSTSSGDWLLDNNGHNRASTSAPQDNKTVCEGDSCPNPSSNERDTKRNQGQFRWDRWPHYLITPRAYHDTVAIDGMVFVIGGCQYYHVRVDTNCLPTKTMEIMNVRNGEWLRTDLKAIGMPLVTFGSPFALVAVTATSAPVIYLAPAASGRVPFDDASAIRRLQKYYELSWPGTSTHGNLANGSKISLRECDFSMSVARYGATFFSHEHHIYIVGGVNAQTGYPALSFEVHAMCCDSLGTCPEHANALFHKGFFAEDILLVANSSIVSPITHAGLGSVLAYGNIRMLVMGSSASSCRDMFPLGTIVAFRSVRLLFNLGDVMLLSVMRCDDSIIHEVIYPKSYNRDLSLLGGGDADAVDYEAFIQAQRPQYRFPSMADQHRSLINDEHIKLAVSDSDNRTPKRENAFTQERERATNDASIRHELPAGICSPAQRCSSNKAAGGGYSLLTMSRDEAFREVRVSSSVYMAELISDTEEEKARKKDILMGRRGVTVVRRDVDLSPTAVPKTQEVEPTTASSQPPVVSSSKTSTNNVLKFHTSTGRFISQPMSSLDGHGLPVPSTFGPTTVHKQIKTKLEGKGVPMISGGGENSGGRSFRGLTDIDDSHSDHYAPEKVSFTVPPRAVMIFDLFILPLNRTSVLACSFFGGCEVSGVVFDMMNGASLYACSGNVISLGGVLWGPEPVPSVVSGLLLDVVPSGGLYGPTPAAQYIMPNDKLIAWPCALDSFLCRSSMGLVIPTADVGCVFAIENVRSQWQYAGSAINASLSKRAVRVHFCGSRVGCPASRGNINASFCLRKQKLDPSLCIARDMCPYMDEDGFSYCCERSRIGPNPSPPLSFSSPLSAQNIDVLPFSSPNSDARGEHWLVANAAYIVVVLYSCVGGLVLLCGLAFLRYYGSTARGGTWVTSKSSAAQSNSLISKRRPSAKMLKVSDIAENPRQDEDEGDAFSFAYSNKGGNKGGRGRPNDDDSLGAPLLINDDWSTSEEDGAAGTLTYHLNDAVGGDIAASSSSASSGRGRRALLISSRSRTNEARDDATEIGGTTSTAGREGVTAVSTGGNVGKQHIKKMSEAQEKRAHASSSHLSLPLSEGSRFTQNEKREDVSQSIRRQMSDTDATSGSLGASRGVTPSVVNTSESTVRGVGHSSSKMSSSSYNNTSHANKNNNNSLKSNSYTMISGAAQQHNLGRTTNTVTTATSATISQNSPFLSSKAQSVSYVRDAESTPHGAPQSSAVHHLSVTTMASESTAGESLRSGSGGVGALVADGTGREPRAAKLRKKNPNSRASLRREPVYLAGYRVIDVIGEGTYGLVLKAVRRHDRHIVAIKFMVCRSDADRQKAMQEYRLVKKFQGCPNIVQISDLFINWEEEEFAIGGSGAHSVQSTLGLLNIVGSDSHSRSDELSGSLGADELKVVLRSPRFVCVVLDYFPAGDLKRFLQLYPEPFVPEVVAVKILAQTATALAQLHAQTPPIAHRDLKPDNILVDARHNRVLLSDFGLAAEVAEGKNLTRAGTPLYLAPETVAGRGGKESDLWALGCIAYALATRRVGHENARVLFRELKEPGIAELMRDEMRHYSNEYADLTLALLSFEPLMRPSAMNVSAMCSNLARALLLDEGVSMESVSIIPPRQLEVLLTAK